MNSRNTILVLSAVLIAAVLSGCIQETSEIGTPGGAAQSNIAPPAAVPDSAQPAPASEAMTSSVPAPPMIVNWKYIGYRNLSISNAPALNQTARITYSIIPDKDTEVLLVYLSIPDGFELMDVEGRGARTWHNTTYLDTIDAKWFPTNLSKDKMYQFSATIKAVKTGNWTIQAYRTNKGMYISVSEDSAYISDEPFPDPYRGTRINESEFDRMHANMPPDIRPTFPGGEVIVPPESAFVRCWNGTAWIRVKAPPKNMTSPHWNGTAWVESGMKKPIMGNQS